MSETTPPADDAHKEAPQPEEAQSETTNESQPATDEAPSQEASSESSPEPTQEPEKEKVPDAVREARIDRMRKKQQSQQRVPALQQDPTFMPNMSMEQVDEELERELQEAMGDLSDDQIFGEMMTRRDQDQQQSGRKKGKVISIHNADVFIDVPGSRSQGVLPIGQFGGKRPEIGTEVEINIEGYDGQNGLLILTRKGAAVEADWDTVAEGMIVEARVLETNKGGLSVTVNGIRGFMPISQIELFRVEDTNQYVNQKLQCEVTEVKPEERNLVVSRRALLERQREEEREKIWAELVEGQIREGVIRKVEKFGAFVDLGGVDGLLHVSEMSWSRVNHPADLVEPGQRLKVAVLKVDHEQRRIGLGIKQLEASPWDDVPKNYPAGAVVKGTVTRLMEFGAFVELEPAVEGLIHISELADHHIKRVGDVVQAGQELEVQILNVDMERKRIGLSLKATQTPAATETEEPTEESEVEETEPVKPPRKRNFQLRGGIGGGELPFEQLDGE